MKNIPIIGILAVASLLIGCRSTPTPQTTTPQAVSPQAALAQSEASQSAALQSPIDIVRNGYLESNKTTTIGNALAGTYKDGTWKSFTSDRGATVVEFDATEPHSESMLQALLIAQQTNDKIDAECKAQSDKVEADKKEESKGTTQEGPDTADLSTCQKAASERHANDPILVNVQFTVNHDGTFQYHSNSMGMSTEELIAKIYD
jgi:hypothetical protein